MESITIMNKEHEIILRMLKVLRSACFKILQGDEINYDDFEIMIEFIRKYADNHHHKKEEKILFSKMVEEIGVLADKIITNGMLVEHDLGRMYISDLEKAMQKVKNHDEEAKLDVIANAISYTHLLERHIDKEDRVIYEFAKRELNDSTKKLIDKLSLEYEKQNEEIRDHYIEVLDNLEKKY